MTTLINESRTRAKLCVLLCQVLITRLLLILDSMIYEFPFAIRRTHVCVFHFIIIYLALSLHIEWLDRSLIIQKIIDDGNGICSDIQVISEQLTCFEALYWY